MSLISRHNRKSFWIPVNSERFGVRDIFNESSDCLRKTKVVLLFQCESSHACQSLAPLVETKTKKINSFKTIIGFFFTPPLFLATKVTISFVYYSPKTIKCTQKSKIKKKVYRNRPIEQASTILHIISTTSSCACAQFTS